MKFLTLREVQLAELDMLSEFDRICQTENLRYSLAGGTMLGAVRHKGFIPWDDDIDVCMPRPDYEKLVSVFSDKKISDRYYFTEDRGKGAINPFLKMQDKDICLQNEGIKEVSNLWIDIFPVDGLPAEDEKLAKIYKKSALYRRIIVFGKMKKLKYYQGTHSKFYAFLVKIFVSLYGVKRAIKKSEKYAQRYDYDKCDNVGIITWGCYGVGERVSKREYEQFTKMEFEGREFSVMGCWDSYLHGIYGDYMRLPPEDKRVAHDIKAFVVEKEGDKI